MVGMVGIEPTHHEGTDLQSAATLQLRRMPMILPFQSTQEFHFDRGRKLPVLPPVCFEMVGPVGIEPTTIAL